MTASHSKTRLIDIAGFRILVAIVTIFLVYVYSLLNVYERHRIDASNGDQLQKAWHIGLPGYREIYHLEDTVDLREWVGTKYVGLEARDTKPGHVNPEATAGLALKTQLLFKEYELQERDGHYVLYRPRKVERHFTWRAWYQLTPWRPASNS